MIPSHVPSSFAFRDGTSTISYIFYKVEACAVTGAFRHDLKTSAEVLVSQMTSVSGANQAAPVRVGGGGGLGGIPWPDSESIPLQNETRIMK